MNQFERTRDEIYKDINQVFKEIKSEVHSNYFLSKNGDLARTQNLVCKYVPSMVADKNSLLVDTVLNYLTEDARQVLTGAESHVFNDFYEKNRRWKTMLTDKFQEDVKDEDGVTLSRDPRITYSAGTGFTVFVLSGLLSKAVLIEPLTLPLSLLCGLGASALTYKLTTPLAMDKTEEDLAEYLKQARNRTIQAVQKVIEMYESELAIFLRAHR